jgi:Flp pilus assembly protein TadD
LHGNRASALSFLGRHEEALAEARRAVALDPRSAVLRGILGHVLLESGASDAALSALDEGARLDPDDPRYDVMRASALGRLGRAAEACAALRRAASLSGGKPLPEGAYARSREMGCGVERPR